LSLLRKTGTKLADLEIDQRSVDPVRGVFTEGKYVVMLKTVSDMVSHVIKTKKVMDANTEIWGSLTSRERALFRKAQAEIAMLAALTLLGAFLKAHAEDDDDETLWMATFFTRRLYSELRAPTDPQEFFKYFKQPAVSTSAFEKILKVAGQGVSDLYNLELERFKSGPNQDEIKLFLKFQKTIPGWNKIPSVKNYDWKKMYEYLEKGGYQ
jgi:hypothetical protein